MSSRPAKLPPWLSKRLPPSEALAPVREALARLRLATVCREAHCPNAGECFARGTATFMILGRTCTRNCTFCAVCSGEPEPLEPEEPERVARAVAELGLRHAVITSVTRDDLPDGGSGHFARTIRAVREGCQASIEVLVPDFGGRRENVAKVTGARPDVFNHNVETVPRLYPEVRPMADYRRSLAVLEQAAEAGLVTKSGMMLGLGEREEEVMATMEDLRRAGCRALTLGQYLRPSPRHHPVVEFVPPERFERWGRVARQMGFEGVASGPFVRSSYKAGQMARDLLREQPCRRAGVTDR